MSGARMLFSGAMAISALKAMNGERAARGCPVAEEAALHFLGLDEAERARVEPHFASFLRLRVTAPAAAAAEAWAAYDALNPKRPAAGFLPGDWRGRADAGLGL